jgi:hypothetical protein
MNASRDGILVYCELSVLTLTNRKESSFTSYSLSLPPPAKFWLSPVAMADEKRNAIRKKIPQSLITFSQPAPLGLLHLQLFARTGNFEIAFPLQ